MLWPLLTLLLWTISAYASSRCARRLGPSRANRWRLSLALAVGVVLILAGGLWPGWQTGMWWFLLAGLCHLGLGDLALFTAFRLLGPRLGALLGVCLSAPLAALIEWLALGTLPGWPRSLAGIAVLLAVAVAIAPADRLRLGRSAVTIGLAAGVCAALGQALGAVSTRHGYELLAAADAVVDPFTAAMLRVAGGLAVVLVMWAANHGPWRQSAPVTAYDRLASRSQGQTGPIWPWMVITTVFGPLLGIAAYQQALATVPAGPVQAVIAALPVTLMPLAWLIDGDRPGRRAILGSIAAVSLVAVLVLV